jgi:ABC-type Fe3+-siderophore transport system permease subunit
VRPPSAALRSLGLILAALLVSVVSLLYRLPDDATSFVLWQLRAPRVVLGLLAGSQLALVGAAYQTLFRNPLAESSTLGTTAGAALGALLSLTLDLEGFGSFAATSVFAFAGAVAASFLVLRIAASSRARLEEVLLAGIAVTLASSALAQAAQSLTDPNRLFAATMWSMGQLPQVGFERVAYGIPPLLGATVLLLRNKRALSAMLLGEPWARSLGVPTQRVRLEVLLASCLSVGVVVGLCGPIAFVGLIVPHLARPLVRGDANALMSVSALLGASFLALSDLFARTCLPDRELPVGALTAALGAPLLLWIIARRPRHSS